MQKLLIAFVYLISRSALVAAGGAVTLTLDNFDEIRAGRNAFVKFHATWCGHCKAMKEDWNTLGDQFDTSSSVLIGDVECTETEEGKAMCEKWGVKGYPTIKYFTDGDTEGKDYQKGRDLPSLIEFTKEELEIKCDVNNPTECTDKEKDYITKMKKNTSADRTLTITRLNGMAGQSMKSELKQWIAQRLHILKSLEKGSGAAEEL